jgi:threonine aldolase
MIDLRSDTITLPTEEMRRAMAQAEVGDAARGEDPTVRRLEELAAEKLGKEAALFVTSGTQGNLVCLMTHASPGEEVIFDEECHAYYFEAGGFARIAGLSPRLVKSKYGFMEPQDIEAAIRPPSTNYPKTRLLVIENTHNRGGGNAISLKQMAAMSDVARKHGLSVHLDGARIFNAALALGVEAKDIAAYADSVQFCLSKGLSAPVGSVVVGSQEFIQGAARARKVLGGDLRQSGVLAAAGIVALEKMVDRLAEDHYTAKLLREGLMEIPQLVVDTPPNPTNMVFVETSNLGISGAEFAARLKEHGVLVAVYGKHRVRMVTHRHIEPGMIEGIVEAVRSVVNSL